MTLRERSGLTVFASAGSARGQGSVPRAEAQGGPVEGGACPEESADGAGTLDRGLGRKARPGWTEAWRVALGSGMRQESGRREGEVAVPRVACCRLHFKPGSQGVCAPGSVRLRDVSVFVQGRDSGAPLKVPLRDLTTGDSEDREAAPDVTPLRDVHTSPDVGAQEGAPLLCPSYCGHGLAHGSLRRHCRRGWAQPVEAPRDCPVLFQERRALQLLRPTHAQSVGRTDGLSTARSRRASVEPLAPLWATKSKGGFVRKREGCLREPAERS